MAKRQAAVHRRTVTTHQTTNELHALVKKELGVDVDPIRLRSFVCDRFHLLSVIAHELHEAEARGEFPKPQDRW